LIHEGEGGLGEWRETKGVGGPEGGQEVKLDFAKPEPKTNKKYKVPGSDG